MERAKLSAIAGSGAERNLYKGAPAVPCTVGKGEMNGAGGAFGDSRKRSRAEFIQGAPAVSRTVGKGEMNGAGGAFGDSRKRSRAEFIQGAPAVSRTVGKGEMNGAGGAFGDSRKRSRAKFISTLSRIHHWDRPGIFSAGRCPRAGSCPRWRPPRTRRRNWTG